MKLVWRASALDDLQTIISYIADRNLPAAVRLHEAIDACAEALRDHPVLISLNATGTPAAHALRDPDEHRRARWRKVGQQFLGDERADQANRGG